jgi:hypothetical protein
MTRDARLSALHRGGFGLRGRASLTGICAGSVTASSSHPGLSAWRAGSRASRGERLRAAAAGRHASLRIQDRLENTPSMSEAGNGSSIASNCSQVKNAFCRQKTSPRTARFRVPGAAQREAHKRVYARHSPRRRASTPLRTPCGVTVRCRPGTIAHSESATVPDQRCTAPQELRAAPHPGHETMKAVNARWPAPTPADMLAIAT